MVKKPTTYEEQMNILKSRNIVIKDEQFCLSVLENLNYYRLTAYMLPFKLNGDNYMNVEFETIYNIYEFDRKLRTLLIGVLEEIELYMRTKLSYYHGHKYGALGYYDPQNYNHKHNDKRFKDEFSNVINKNKDNPFVKHHIYKYNGEFPIWVAVELFSFGMLSRFYADLKIEDKNEIAQKLFETNFKHLESWLLCLSTLRNRCAHYMRLYYYNFNKYPRWPKGRAIERTNKIFDLIYMLKFCYPYQTKWRNSFLQSLNAIIEEYKEYINLEHIGFPNDWGKFLIM